MNEVMIQEIITSDQENNARVREVYLPQQCEEFMAENT